MKNIKIRLIFAVFMAIIFTSCSSTSNMPDKKAQAESLRNLGEAYLSSGNATIALRELLKANSLYSKDPFTHNDLGLAYMAKGRTEKAILHFNKAVELKPDYAPAVNNLGTAYIAEKNWDMAIKTLVPLTENILYATPHYAETNLAFAYFNKNNFKKAEHHYKNSIDLAPNYVTPYRGLSILYRKTGKYSNSLKLINKAIEITPKSGELYLHKGKTLEFMGRPVEAETAYEQAIKYGNENIVSVAKDAILNL